MKKLVTILFVLLSQTALAQFDSLKMGLSFDTLNVLISKLDSIEASAESRIRDIAKYYSQADVKIQNLSMDYQQKIDSLSHLKLPVDGCIGKIDSLSNLLVNLKQNAESKIQSIKQEVIGKINALQLPEEMQSNVSQVTGTLEKLDLSSLSSEINLPIDLKSIGDLPTLNGFPDIGNNLDNVSNLTNGLTEQTSITQEGVNKITTGVSQANQLDKLAESQVMKLDAVKDFSDATSNLPANPLSSEEEAKKQLLNQAKEIAVDHFAGKEDVLKSAMDKISKYKQKYSSISSLSEITKRPPNPMKGKPFIERVIPGIQFQMFQKQGNFLTDFNLYAGYRINGRLTTGLGWNQRVAYNLDRDEFNPKARVFGPRAFGEFKLGRGFSPRAEVEVMNTALPPYTTSAQADTRSREWIVSGLVGIKKEYRFYKNVKGTTTIMINVLHHYNKSPYPDWVNMRFGFEFPLKKKVVR